MERLATDVLTHKLLPFLSKPETENRTKEINRWANKFVEWTQANIFGYPFKTTMFEFHRFVSQESEEMIPYDVYHILTGASVLDYAACDHERGKNQSQLRMIYNNNKRRREEEEKE